MPLARINGRLLHFVHVPKTGGSSINTYLRSRGKLALYSRNPLDWIGISPQHLHRRAYRTVIPDGLCEASFIVLRDPVDRMISEYKYRAKRRALVRGSEMPSAVEWHDGSAFFGGFDDWAARILDDAKSNASLYDNHIRPQVDFWQPGHAVFHFRDGLKQVFDWIDRVTGCQPSGPPVHENRGAEVPVQISEATRQRILDFYRADIALIRRTGKAGAASAAPGLSGLIFPPADRPGASAE